MDKILEYQDYKNLINFLNNNPVGGPVRAINPLYFFDSERFVDAEFLLINLFNGRAVNLPSFTYTDQLMKSYRTFEEFTGVDEVNNLSSWLIGFINSVDQTLRKGKELEILQNESPRDGRLDAVCISNSSKELFAFEAKKNLISLINEKRFEIQIPEYQKELNRLQIEVLGGDSKVALILTIGGNETDLYPPDHDDCIGGQVGNLSETFYSKILKRNIKFISANALWCLHTYKKQNPDFEVFPFLYDKFLNEDTIGLLTGGIVTKDLQVLPLTLS